MHHEGGVKNFTFTGYKINLHDISKYNFHLITS